jgi:hypothetical protein
MLTDVSEAASTSETSVNFYQITQHNNAGSSHLEIPSSMTGLNWSQGQVIFNLPK